MRVPVVLSVLALAAALATPARAIERYQIAPLAAGDTFAPDKALILDVESGHLWLWIETPGNEQTGGSRMLIYQGQVRPGREMGDIIEKQDWAPSPAPAP